MINPFLACLGISIAVIYFIIFITTRSRKIELFIMMRDFVQKVHVSAIV